MLVRFVENKVFESKARHKKHLIEKYVPSFADSVRLAPFGDELCVLRVVKSVGSHLIRLWRIRLENRCRFSPDKDIRVVGDKAKTSKVFAVFVYVDAVGLFEMPLRSQKTHAVKTGVRMDSNPSFQSAPGRGDKGGQDVWIALELLAEQSRIIHFVDVDAKNPGVHQDFCACTLRESAGWSNSRKPLFQRVHGVFCNLVGVGIGFFHGSLVCPGVGFPHLPDGFAPAP